MLRAVLFDWGHTLMDWVPEEGLLEAGHRAGLEALGRDDLPDVSAMATRFRERYEPLFWAPGTIEEVEYPGLVRHLLEDFEIDVDHEELDRFLAAEHAAWAPALDHACAARLASKRRAQARPRLERVRPGLAPAP